MEELLVGISSCRTVNPTDVPSSSALAASSNLRISTPQEPPQLPREFTTVTAPALVRVELSVTDELPARSRCLGPVVYRDDLASWGGFRPGVPEAGEETDGRGSSHLPMGRPPAPGAAVTSAASSTARRSSATSMTIQPATRWWPALVLFALATLVLLSSIAAQTARRHRRNTI